jgi:hypothetical protein
MIVPTIQPPPAVEPKKKRGVWKWILIVVGTIVALSVALVIIGAALGEDEDTTTPAGSSNATSDKPSPNASEVPTAKIPSPNASEVPTAKIGDEVTDGSYQFTVTKINCGVREIGDQYMGKKAHGQFCLVTMRVKNVGKDPITLSDQNQTLVDTKGGTYRPDDEAWAYVDDPDDISGEINPGTALKTVVPFDVPKKTEPDYLLVMAGAFGFSEGVQVKL